MEIGNVIGSVWATKKAEGINGQKLLVIELLKTMETKMEDGQQMQSLLVAADVIGAGIGDMVLVCRGNPARLTVGNGQVPIDAAVVGIVDSLDLQKQSGWR